MPRGRKRANEGEGEGRADGPSAEALAAWLDGAGVHRGPITVQDTRPRGIRVVAARPLDAGTTLCSVPKRAVLSVLTASAAGAIGAEGLGGGCALTAAVMLERAMGSRSSWAGYLAVCPHEELLPVTWSGDADRLLQGTELEGAASAELDALRDDYADLVCPLLRNHAATLATLGVDPAKTRWSDFRAAASLVSSRAFFVDDDHGLGMVPLADAFNHRSAIIELESGTYIAELGCDSAAEAQGAGADRPLDASGNPFPGLNIRICNMMAEDALDVVLATPVGAGDEIWNTYGELSNAALLAKYGFAERENPHDSVSVRLADVREAVAHYGGDPRRVDALLARDDVFDPAIVCELDFGAEVPAPLLFLLEQTLPERHGGSARPSRASSAALVAVAAAFDPAASAREPRLARVAAAIVALRLAAALVGAPEAGGELGSVAKRVLDLGIRGLLGVVRPKAAVHLYRRLTPAARPPGRPADAGAGTECREWHASLVRLGEARILQRALEKLVVCLAANL